MTRAFKKGKQRVASSPSRMIALSFLLMIAVGTLFLTMPFASKSGESVGVVNALFTATSANCVTGLVVVNTLEHWTLFGQLTILMLIQLGGLGLVSVLTIGMVWLRKNISLENRLLVQTAFNQDKVGGMVLLVRHVLRITLLFEGIGAILLTIGFYLFTPNLGALKAAWMGIFHAVSSFCNAGFDIIGTSSLMPYQNNFFIMLVVMALIVCGGLGFTVWGDLLFGRRQRPTSTLFQKWVLLPLHNKLTLLITAFLIVGGGLFFLAFEWGNPTTLGALSTPSKFLNAAFQSVTLRTCGYFSINQAGLTEPSLLLSCLLMFIGGSPVSTAGGVKTVTLGILLIAVVSSLRGKNNLEGFGRTLPLDLLQKALTVIILLLVVVLTGTFAIYLIEVGNSYQHTLLDLLFEVTSAAGTVGSSTGITPHLSSASKIILSVCMFLGRTGPITVVLALNKQSRKKPDNIAYPHERVIIG